MGSLAVANKGFRKIQEVVQKDYSGKALKMAPM
jgi:hypothetical protein